MIAAIASPPILKFPTLAERTGNVAESDVTTLRSYYEPILLPELADLKPRSLAADRDALAAWERFTDNPDIRSSSAEELETQLQKFRDGHQSSGLAAGTMNMRWRELRAMFSAAVQDGYCDAVPCIRKRRRGRIVTSRLVEQPKKSQREIVTEEELTRLWEACRHATYPAGGEFPASRLWRVALVLFWTYGARTHDFLRHLRWEEVKFSDRLLQFTASKTSKLQGLPLTDTVTAHLRSIRGGGAHVFPGFRTAGHFSHKLLTWKPGYYTTWRYEICRAAGLAESSIVESADGRRGTNWDATVDIKHFRERVVTKYNARHPGLGSWIAGHYMPGVSAQNYDLPTDQIRDEIENTPVPDCFRQVEADRQMRLF